MASHSNTTNESLSQGWLPFCGDKDSLNRETEDKWSPPKAGNSRSLQSHNIRPKQRYTGAEFLSDNEPHHATEPELWVQVSLGRKAKDGSAQLRECCTVYSAVFWMKCLFYPLW